VAVPKALPLTSLVVSLQTQLTLEPVLLQSAMPAVPQVPVQLERLDGVQLPACAPPPSIKAQAKNDADTNNADIRDITELLPRGVVPLIAETLAFKIPQLD
jgi:hypothetical protein